MRKVGLTGGIGSGKSTVSRLLASYGAVVIDADLIAREVIEPGSPGLAAVVEAFGPQIAPGGVLDREALGRRVFADDAQRAVLSGILHPLIGARSAQLWAEAEAAGTEVLVHDVPLLVESDLMAMYDDIVVVDVPPDVQLDRLVRLRGMAEDEARSRVAAQADPARRRAAATTVLDNSGSLRELQQQVEALWARLSAPDSGA